MCPDVRVGAFYLLRAGFRVLPALTSRALDRVLTCVLTSPLVRRRWMRRAGRAHDLARGAAPPQGKGQGHRLRRLP
eukprot:3438320-Rhodomonas_salina.1